MIEEGAPRDSAEKSEENVVPFPGGASAQGDEAEERRDLPEAAKRALAEAEERRRNAKDLNLPKELGGRDGPEPVRYGDWEKGGLAIDF